MKDIAASLSWDLFFQVLVKKKKKKKKKVLLLLGDAQGSWPKVVGHIGNRKCHLRFPQDHR